MAHTSIPDMQQPIELHLPEHEKDEVAQRSRPRAAVLHETIRAEGEIELHRPASALAWSGLAAGLSMGFSLVAMGILQTLLPDAPWRRLIVNLGYSFGFVIVIVGRQQLFTENTLTPVLPLLENRDARTLVRLLRLWGIVLVANLLGTWLFALAVGHLDVFDAGVRESFRRIGEETLEGGFGAHFVRAIFSGWLIALIVWLLPSAEQSRVLIVVALTYLIGIGHLSHVIAGSVEALYAVTTGAATWGRYLGGFFLPVLLGNVVGGAALVGALSHAQVAADRDDDDTPRASEADTDRAR